MGDLSHIRIRPARGVLRALGVSVIVCDGCLAEDVVLDPLRRPQETPQDVLSLVSKFTAEHATCVGRHVLTPRSANSDSGPDPRSGAGPVLKPGGTE